jgi:hypothetical protein
VPGASFVFLKEKYCFFPHVILLNYDFELLFATLKIISEFLVLYLVPTDAEVIVKCRSVELRGALEE